MVIHNFNFHSKSYSIFKVFCICELMEHYGKMKNPKGNNPMMWWSLLADLCTA